jgi:trehalose 6-phosphate phosphatase
MSTAPPPIDALQAALFLDVDGTLLDIQQHPGDVTADDELIEMLVEASERLSGALALITGRALDDVDRIFAPKTFAAAGAHGAEIRPRADAQAATDVERLPDETMQALKEFAAQHPGLLLEEKHGGASLHYRRAPELEHGCREFVTELLESLGEGYRLISGKMVFELAPASHHKGAAIESFLASSPFADRQPIFVGDDVTDEDGFRVVNARGGISVLVGEPRPSDAQYHLDDTNAVRAWLRTALNH